MTTNYDYLLTISAIYVDCVKYLKTLDTNLVEKWLDSFRDLDDPVYVPFFSVVVSARMCSKNRPIDKMLLETEEKNPGIYKAFADLIVDVYCRMSCKIMY